MARGLSVGRWLWRLVGVMVLGVLALQLWYLGWILAWKWFEPGATRFMRDQQSQLQATDPRFQLRHQWVPYEQISRHLKRAVIASEDANFADHDGVDWEALEKAWDQNQKKGKVVRGGSTITMQLAKNLFLSGERSYWRKGQELIITVMLEAVLDKRRIFEIYLNVAEWGIGVFGAEAGARHHFSIGAAQLSPEQAARMAAMLPRPRFYDRNRGSRALTVKTGIILRRMPVAELP